MVTLIRIGFKPIFYQIKEKHIIKGEQLMVMPSKKTITLIGLILTILVIIGLTLYISNKNTATQDAATSLTEADNPNDTASNAMIEIAMRERSLGSPDAPIVIEDYSSLTCPHCAQFHTEVLPKLKESHIDTGKVRLIFKDFPLNLPALQASSISRCVEDDDAYFAYLDLLFSTQSDWATDTNAKDKLLNNVGITGLSREEASNCLESAAITQHILTAQNDAKNRFNIDSTPFFIINDGKGKIRGVRTYDMFLEELDKIMAGN